MAAVQNPDFPGSGHGNPYLDSIVWGCKWDGGPILYWFGSGVLEAADSSVGEFTGAEWSAYEIEAFERAIAEYESVCNIDFEAAATREEANMVWWLAPDSVMGEGVLGMHEIPDASYPQIYGYFSYENFTWPYLDEANYGYITVIHELGHGVGLAHPHDGGGDDDATTFPGVLHPFHTGTNGLNQGVWSTMSYNDGWTGEPSQYVNAGWQTGLMSFDIAVLQLMYGANMETRTGDDVYLLPAYTAGDVGFDCIWDAGGIDTISLAGGTADATINLNAASLTGKNAGGYVSHADGVLGGFTIAHDVVIENAIGGSGRDTITGNAAANRLDGGAGADVLAGGAGDDTYVVDHKKDSVKDLGGGHDTIEASVTFKLSNSVEDLVLTGDAAIDGTGNGDENTLTGNAAANKLDGGGDDDTLVGGGGTDRLTGGSGADSFRFDDGDTGTGAARDVITDFKVVQKDRIDLSMMDANTTLADDQGFTFLGTAGFSNVAGQLRFSAGVLSGDVNGDGVADFEIGLTGVSGSLAVGVLVL